MPVPSLISLVLISLVTLSGCQKRLHVHGNPFAHTLSAALQPGVSSQQDAEELLGAPTLINDNNWLYVLKKTESQAFLSPTLIEQNATMLEFNQKGILQKVITRTQDDAHAIKITKRVTKLARGRDSAWRRAMKKHTRDSKKDER